MDELKFKGIKNDYIIYMNFELFEYYFIKSAKDLNDHLKSLVKNKNEIYYIFLDEVQKVPEFEKVINSLRVSEKCSIFVTGSNSRMTVRELSTDLI